MTINNIARKLFMLGVLSVYTFIFAEMFIRIFAPVPIMPRYVTDGGDGIRQNIPHSSYRQKTQEVDIEVRINGQGMRMDRDIPLAKPEGICRIALFGDSFFMGYEVDIEKSAPYLLEKKLQQNGYACEILNFSVSGFGTAEYLVALEKRALAYQPDLVLYELHNTDFDETIRSGLYRLNNTGELERTTANYLPAIELRDKLMQYGIYRWLIGNSHLYSSVRERAAIQVKKLLLAINNIKLGMNDAHAKPEATKQQTAQPVDTISHDARLLNALLEKSRDVSNENNAKFALIEIPTQRTRTRFSSVMEKALKPLDISKRFSTITPLDAFREHANPETKLYFEQGHGHLTELGNELVAQSAFDYITQHNLLSKN